MVISTHSYYFGVQGTAPAVTSTLAPTPPEWSGVGCPNAYVTGGAYVGGSKVAVGTLAYECKAGAASGWCPLAGYTPGTGTAWDQAWTLLGSCDPAIALTPAPTTLAPTAAAWSGVGCPNAYVAGGAYVGGSTVAVGTMVYECKAGAASGWCPLTGYTPGTGTAWDQAWTLKGSCTGTIAPTTLSPTATQPGCPSAWVSGTAYAAGAMVSAGGKSFQCNAHPMSLFCGQSGYEPNTEMFGGAYKLAWTDKGSCAGTLAPVTASPTVTPVYTVAGACPAAYAAGAAYSAGTKVTTVTAGGKNVYECKAFPYSGYCSQAGYEPNGTYGSMGWTLLGVCDPVATDSPSTAPTASPSKAPTATPTASPSKAPTAKPTASPSKAPTPA
jgi:hypothetical protein